VVASETRVACSVDVDSIMAVRTMDRSERWRTSLMVHSDGIVSWPLGVGCFRRFGDGVKEFGTDHVKLSSVIAQWEPCQLLAVVPGGSSHLAMTRTANVFVVKILSRQMRIARSVGTYTGRHFCVDFALFGIATRRTFDVACLNEVTWQEWRTFARGSGG
jgi:hypothetical protein